MNAESKGEESLIKTFDFAYAFARFVHFYHWSYEQVMDSPIRVFWSMYHQINRIRAETDLRHLHIVAMAQSKDGYESASQTLLQELDEPVEVDRLRSAKRDEDGIAMLKSL